MLAEVSRWYWRECVHLLLDLLPMERVGWGVLTDEGIVDGVMMATRRKRVDDEKGQVRGEEARLRSKHFM